eukprot:CAMPEP_0170491598 /NCGR_PEP_ID=MMETSP0208-20121228/11143_1 /TAXON_ID=197538 /ORGANISM="Strombidium inclinatum, Strain S3" /LENGTH=164 /DNA_ID=CAMNT_0010767195 /DNA_START=43 /DNA_END=537 /DNA_ORIENTATION=+
MWVSVQENLYQKKMKDQFDPNDLQEIISFTTIQEFWEVYQHLRRPTAMPYGTTMNIFANGIKPVWEDPSLKDGARFQMKLPKTHTSKYWEDLLLAMIGEQLGEEGLVAGLVMNLKPQFDKIGIWVTDCKNAAGVEALRVAIIDLLKIDAKELEYEVFGEIQKGA